MKLTKETLQHMILEELNEFSVTSDHVDDIFPTLKKIIKVFSKKWGISTYNTKEVIQSAMRMLK